MFHHFHSDEHPVGQGSISADELDDMIDFLGAERIIGAGEWLNRASTNSLGDNELCLTFDDALRCQYDIALPVLEKRGLTAFWFVYSSVFEGSLVSLEVYRYFRHDAFASVEAFYSAFEDEVACSGDADLLADKTSDFDPNGFLSECSFYTDEDRRFRFIRDDVLGPDRYRVIMDSMMAKAGYDPRKLTPVLWMSGASLKRLDESGHIVGLHSHTHPTRIAELSAEEQFGEYRRNHQHLSGLLEKPVKSMSHPCNSYSETTLAILENLGIEMGFRADMTEVADRGLLELPREDHANILSLMRS